MRSVGLFLGGLMLGGVAGGVAGWFAGSLATSDLTRVNVSTNDKSPSETTPPVELPEETPKGILDDDAPIPERSIEVAELLDPPSSDPAHESALPVDQPAVVVTVDFAGSGATEAVVKLMRWTTDDSLDLELLGRSPREADVLLDQPKATFVDLIPGRYAVGLRRDYATRVQSHVLVEVSGRMDVRLSFPPVDSARSLDLRVTEWDGRPVDDVVCGLFYEGDASRARSADWVTTALHRQGEGRYLLEAFPRDDRPDLFGVWPDGVQFRLQVEHERFGIRYADLVEGQRQIEFTYAQPGTLQVTVDGVGECSVSDGLLLVLTSDRQDDEESMGIPTLRRSLDSSGSAMFEAVSPGNYRLDLRVEDWRGQARRLERTSVFVESGDQEVRISCPPLYDLSVVIPDPLNLRELELRPAGSRRSSARESVRDGKATFRGLVPGRYILEGDLESGTELMAVEVPTSGEVRFDSAPANAFSVVINDDEGTLAKLGWRTGDLLVGINGETFDGMIEFQGALLKALGQESFEADLDRRGERLTITTPTQPFLRSEDLGASLLPAVRN